MMRTPAPQTLWWTEAVRRRRSDADAPAALAGPGSLESSVLEDAIAVALSIDLGSGPRDALAARVDERHPLWDAAAERGDAPGCWLVGLCLLRGIGTQPDEATGVRLLRQAAEASFAPALHSLARLEQAGLEPHVPADEAAALSRYRDAAEQGYPPSMCNLGVALLEGSGVARSVASGLGWLRRAAEAGNAVAQINLGALYADGELVPEDPVEAARWYRRAAERGHAGALCLLGMCYEDGLGVVRDPRKAADCYRQAAEQGDVEAQLLLGYCYEEGTGVAADPLRALLWYRRAAEAGNPQAQVALGSCYRHGVGVARDPEQAVKWFGLAADQDDVEALYQLATCYTHGEGVPRDHAAAVELYRRCVPHEHAEAIFSLGVAYARGDGVERNLPLGMRFFEKAASLGCEPAIAALRAQPGASDDDPRAIAGELLAALLDESASFEAARSAAVSMMETAATLAPAALDPLAKRLSRAIAEATIDRAGVAALVCGALVESGADPETALAPLVERLPAVLLSARSYLRRCRQRHLEQTGALLEDPDLLVTGEVEAVSEAALAAALAAEEDARELHPDNDDRASEDDDEPLEPDIPPSIAAWVAERYPDDARAWHALDFWCQPAIAMLSRADEARAALPREALREALDILRHEHRGAAYLWQLVEVLDDEPLLVLDPTTKRGYRLRISGISDNFQLHTLLAARIVGDPAAGLLEGRRPSEAVLDVARGDGPQQLEVDVMAQWEIFDWRALRSNLAVDASAPEAEEHRVAIEDFPAAIPTFDGVRTVLLAPTARPRAWSAARTFGALHASIELEEILEPAEVERLLRRIAAAN